MGIGQLNAGRCASVGLKGREETICLRDETIATAQDRVEVLERKVEKEGLTIIIFINVIKLSNLPAKK